MNIRYAAMRSLTAITAVLVALSFVSARGAQTAATSLRQMAGTWTLVSIERPAAGGRMTSLPLPRGLLVLDTAGHVFEGVQHGRPQGAPALGDRQLVFASFSGFWGTFTLEPGGQSLTIAPRGAVHPNLEDARFTRTIVVTADPPTLSPTSHPARLTMTAGASEPYPGTRWTWERVPPVESLTPGYRQVSGFWEHVIEKRINLTTGTSQDSTRAPSVIVYTPSGYVGVHFPPRGRKKLAGNEPTEEEARAALDGYIGYFGALTVYPGQVFHHPLANIGLIAQGNTIKRFYEVSGSNVIVTFPATGTGAQQNTTAVTLKRLSGIDEMLPQ